MPHKSLPKSAYFGVDNHYQCLNPHCSQFGTPHVGCHCYEGSGDPAADPAFKGAGHEGGTYVGGYAKGGEVEKKFFCSKDQEHKKNCKYFADGGDVIPEGAIPADQFTPDAAPAPTSSNVPEGAIPADQFTPDAAPEGAIPADQFVPDSQKYGTPIEMAKTALEGAAQGIAGPLATGAERLLGVKPEDIAGRAEANPFIHGGAEAASLVGSALIPGLGEYTIGSAAAKAAEAAAAASKVAEYSNIGSKVLQGAIQTGLITGSDETSKYLMGQSFDPSAVGASMLAGGVMGGLGGGLYGLVSPKISEGLETIAANKLGAKGTSFLAGIANAANPAETSIALEDAAYLARKNAPEALKQALGDVDEAWIPKVAKFDQSSLGGFRRALQDSKAFDAGKKAWERLSSKISGAEEIGDVYNIYHTVKEGYEEQGVLGAVKGVGTGLAEDVAFHYAGKGANYALSKYGAPVLLKILSSQKFGDMAEGLSFAKNLSKGQTAIEKGVRSLFGAGISQSINSIPDSDRRKLKEFISGGGVQSQVMATQMNQSHQASGLDSLVSSAGSAGGNSGGAPLAAFAGGGEVALQSANARSLASRSLASLGDSGEEKNLGPYIINQDKNNISKNDINISPTNKIGTPGSVSQALNQSIFKGSRFIDDNYPGLSTIIGSAKGRISDYLQQVAPQKNPVKLPFDHDPNQITQARSYDKAIDLAIKPLGILDHIKNGSLEPSDMQHMNAMYPELVEHLRGKIGEQITKNMIKDGTLPPYQVRQSMAMFMGQPLGSEMTQPSIMAAQNVFQSQKAQQAAQMPPVKNKKGTSSLNKVSQQYETGDQARAARANKS